MLTIRQDFAELGIRAVALLLQQLDGGAGTATPDQILPELIVRESTAPFRR